MQDLARLIDEAIVLAGGEPGHEDTEPRGHLGASVVGKECVRQIWYGFRWATPSQFEGRMLRLFATGFKYEHRFIALLKILKIRVEEIDYSRSHSLWYHPESDCYYIKLPGAEITEAEGRECFDVTDMTDHVACAKLCGVILPKMKQFGFKESHFAGSCDGIATAENGSPILQDLIFMGLEPNDEFLTEFKTHGEKSFAKLLSEGVKKAKPEHYAQMTTYMQKKQKKLTLYCAVNKNTDQLYFEWVAPDPLHAEQMNSKALGVITARQPPMRINNSPSWFECRYCDHRMTCHFGKDMQKNCRTCVHSAPVANGEWLCQKWSAIIPFKDQQIGCDAWQQIRD